MNKKGSPQNLAAYHEVNGTASSKNVSTWHNGSTTIQPFRRPRVVKGSSLGVQLHVPRVDTRAIYPPANISWGICASSFWAHPSHSPWVVEVVLSSLDQKHLQTVIEVGQTTRWHAARATATTDDDIDFLWNRHFQSVKTMYTRARCLCFSCWLLLRITFEKRTDELYTLWTRVREALYMIFSHTSIHVPAKAFTPPYPMRSFRSS
jgi:hypothetical protein